MGASRSDAKNHRAASVLRRALEGLTAQEQTAISLVVRGVLPEAALRPELDRIAADRATLEARLATVEAQGTPSLPTMASRASGAPSASGRCG